MQIKRNIMSNKQFNKQTSNNQAGFTLVEVMVALLILSVGLLGMAGLQMEGMNSNHDAMLRTIATQHAADMSERIRSSRGGFIVTDAAGTESCNDNGNCPPRVQSDFDAWTTTIANTLPSGDGRVIALGNAAAGTNTIQITVRWDENGTGANQRNCPPISPLDLQCVQIPVIP